MGDDIDEKLPICLRDYGKDMREIVQALKEIYGIRTDADLANRMYVSLPTLKGWKQGRNYPSQVNAEKIALLLSQKNWGSTSCQRDTFVAYNTVSYDSVRNVYDQVATIGDPIALSCAVHSILVKVACLIENANTTGLVTNTHGIPVQKMHSVYGVPDYGEVMNCTYLQRDGTYSNRTADLLIKIAAINNKYSFVYQLELIYYGKVEKRTSGLISDRSLDKISKSILEHMTKHIHK